MKRRLMSLLLALVLMLGLAAPAMAYTWEEEPNSTLYNAVEMKQHTEYRGDLYAVSDEVDMYHFTVQEDAYLTFHLWATADTLEFVLFDAGGGVITQAVYVGQDAEGFDWYELQRDIAAGDYYLGVFALDGENHGYEATLYLGEAYYDNGYHSWYASKPITPATCTTEGVALYQCRCGETKTDVAPTDPEAHTWEVTITTAPTCEEYGSAHYKCTSCGSGHDEALYPEHTGRVDVVAEEPTVDEPGYGGFYCTDCGWEEYEHWIAPLNHHFIDVKPGSFCDDPIKWACSTGVTSGVTDYHFGPNTDCNRAQIVTFLWRAAGSPEPEITAHPFTDVVPGSFYEKAVLWAVENGITNGTSATAFSPMKTCTRAEVVTFLWRAEGKPAANASNPFEDVPGSGFFREAVLWAVENEITNGLDAAHFGPYTICNRAQVVTFLYRTAMLPEPLPEGTYRFTLLGSDPSEETGYVYCEGEAYAPGERVTFYAEPWYGYLVEFYAEPEDAQLELYYLGANCYELVMPAHDVTLTAYFVPAEGSNRYITINCENGFAFANCDMDDGLNDFAKPGEFVQFYVMPDEGYTFSPENFTVTAGGEVVEDCWYLGELVEEDDFIEGIFLFELVMPDADVTVSITCTPDTGTNAAAADAMRISVSVR